MTTTFYIQSDYDNAKKNLPEILENLKIKENRCLEPTLDERKAVMQEIRNFIQENDRIIYGGTALNEALKAVDPKLTFYTDENFADIEFYSFEPKYDGVKLCNYLYEKNYKYIRFAEATHENTYTLYVNFHNYCDITYVPKLIYSSIRTLTIHHIRYVHPHFSLIDQLRIMNHPMTAGTFRWEKTFERMYRSLQAYPFTDDSSAVRFDLPAPSIMNIVASIRRDFIAKNDIKEKVIICGFEAYNFFIRHALDDRHVEQPARPTRALKQIATFEIKVPFFECISIDYENSVIQLYNYLRTLVENVEKLTIIEYVPFFQFLDYSTDIVYDGILLARIYRVEHECIPFIRIRGDGYMFSTFQYTLMMLLISRFRYFVLRNHAMRHNYTSLICNLIQARNYYFEKHDYTITDKSIFKEFVIQCVGHAVSTMRQGRIRNKERWEKGKSSFNYQPDIFFTLSSEKQNAFDPTVKDYQNISGNPIKEIKNYHFIVNPDSIERKSDLTLSDNEFTDDEI